MPQHLGHKNMTLKSSNIRPRTLSVLIVLSMKKHNKSQANGRLSSNGGQLPWQQYNATGTWVRGWKTTAVHGTPLKTDYSREFCDEEHAVQQPQPQRPLSRPANIAISQQIWCKWQQALASFIKKYYDVCSAHKVAIEHEMPQPTKLFYVWRSISSCTIKQKQKCKM